MKKLRISLLCLAVEVAVLPGYFSSSSSGDHIEKGMTQPAGPRKGSPSVDKCKTGSITDDKKRDEILDRVIASLIAKAQRNGTVNIIVGLCVDFVPEGRLPGPREVRAQRQSIVQAQDMLLKKLVRQRIVAVKKYEFAPFIAMQVDPAALRFLKTSSLVLTVEEDLPATPMN